MNAIKSISFGIIRFLVVWFVDSISLLITAWVIPGISILRIGNVPELVIATIAALVEEPLPPENVGVVHPGRATGCPTDNAARIRNAVVEKREMNRCMVMNFL